MRTCIQLETYFIKWQKAKGVKFGFKQKQSFNFGSESNSSITSSNIEMLNKDCFFRALSVVITGDEEYYNELCLLIVSRMKCVDFQTVAQNGSGV